MKRIIVTCCFAGTLLAAASCGEKPTDPVVEESYNITVKSADWTALTATISGVFNGIEKTDLVFGRYGVLYCEKSDDDGNIFKSWKETGDYSGFLVFDGAKISGLSYTGTVTGLKPDTEYSFCLFSQGRDSAKREISAIQTFRTKPFAPVISEVSMENIRYFDAVAKGSIKSIDDTDAGICEIGFLLSESEDCNMTNSTAYPFEAGADLKSPSFWLMQLDPATTMHIRIYISYPTPSGQNAYAYGPEVTFSTRDFNETAVDLGLPSGIRWSSIMLGDEQPFPKYYNGVSFQYSYFQWGASARFHTSKAYDEDYIRTHYEHWDAASSSCRDIGTEISGTEYDVVHIMLGGKWRMPSKADVEELIANCNVSEIEKDSNNGSAYLGIIKGPNGNVVKMHPNSAHLWCGTAADNDNAYVFTYSGEFYRDADGHTYYYKSGTGCIKIVTDPKYGYEQIWPVWDPTMPDE